MPLVTTARHPAPLCPKFASESPPFASPQPCPKFASSHCVPPPPKPHRHSPPLPCSTIISTSASDKQISLCQDFETGIIINWAKFVLLHVVLSSFPAQFTTSYCWCMENKGVGRIGWVVGEDDCGGHGHCCTCSSSWMEFVFLNDVECQCELPESYEAYRKQQHLWHSVPMQDG